MTIKQFEDKGLAHFSYVVMSEGEMALIDPARDPQPYYEYAMLHDARIVAVVETHPHADFVSSHLEICDTKEAEVYTSQLTGAAYPHTPFDDGDFFQIGELTLHALNTPGHSPDSLCVLVKDASHKPWVLFSGDTLFIGDVGRPDLREKAGSQGASRESLARALYRSTREKILSLPDEVLVYPGHGAGSLCGKSLSPAPSSTIGAEKEGNQALQPMSEEAFVALLLADQPFVPLYFPYDVALNKHGAPILKDSLRQVPHLEPDCKIPASALLVDTRPAAAFRQGHLPQALNIQDGLNFETWLGAIIAPEERFYLVAGDAESLKKVIAKTAKIGYEAHIKGALVHPKGQTATSPQLDLAAFKDHPDTYTVVDIRNPGEENDQSFFSRSLHIPLPELRRRAKEIPTHKPIVVHCSSGYRSAAGSSILATVIKEQPVYDLGEGIKDFGAA
jgi:hydroxyacylglutathione hydrolase